MKLRERLEREIREHLIRAFIFSGCAAISFFWIKSIPRAFGFLLAAALIFFVDAILVWIKWRKVNPFVDDVVARSVKVLKVGAQGLELEDGGCVAWGDIIEVRKVFRASFFDRPFYMDCGSYPAVSSVRRRFFYAVQLQNKEWLSFPNIGIASGGFTTPNSKAFELVRNFLTEAGKHAHILFLHHNEILSDLQVMDPKKELEKITQA